MMRCIMTTTSKRMTRATEEAKKNYEPDELLEPRTRDESQKPSEDSHEAVSDVSGKESEKEVVRCVDSRDTFDE